MQSSKLMAGTLAGLLIAGVFTACHHTNQPDIRKDPLDLSGMDTTVRPQDDFFRYANGNWLKETQIPASQPAWGAIFTLSDHSVHDMREILDSVSALKNAVKGSIEQQAGDLYASGMDSSAIEKLGIIPLQPDLNRIRNIKDLNGLWNEVAVEYSMGINPLFSFYVSADDKNSSVEIAHFDQGGLGLPNKDYYFKNDPAIRKIRDAYQDYIAGILWLTGDDSVHARMESKSVILLETALAKISKSPVDLRDPIANYHKLSLKEMDKNTPGTNWEHVLHSMQIQQDTVLMGQPEFYKGLAGLLHSASLNDWKDYLRFHLVNEFASYLSSPFVKAEFNFSKLLTGQKEQPERWKRMSRMVDENLGDALGQLYVKRFFPPAAKQRMVELVNNLQQTYEDRIKHLDWMSDSTKAKALDKLHAMVKKIGYPDKWKDYSSISISRDSLVANLKNCGRYAYMRNIHKLGKPVDKSEWYMTPPTVDAYYNPTTNDINFPAGILQPPFFFRDGDDAVNYGAIGIVIGHEMTHGFDDQGRQYDAEGNLKDWWTPEDAAKFKQRTNLVVRQYNSYTVLDSLHINGELTLGENIADVGGTAIAFAAFKKTPEGQSDKKMDGFTPDQRFFLSLAQIWRVKYRDEILRTTIMNNPHSTARYRVIGPVTDAPGFYKAFNIKPGDKMYRPDSVRVHIW